MVFKRSKATSVKYKKETNAHLLNIPLMSFYSLKFIKNLDIKSTFF